MNDIFVFLFLASLVGLGIGIIKPMAFEKYLKGNITRGKLVKVFGGVTLLFFILIGMTSDTKVDSSKNEANKAQQNNNQTTEKKQEENNIAPVQQELNLVKRVIDGDTIELENGKTVRYIGIDTPETVHPDKPVQCYGKESSDKNKSLVEGKKVKLEKDVSETDKYDRLLRYVYLEDGTFVNLALVKEGFAKGSTYPPDVKHQDEFTNAEREARNSQKGLWSSTTCNGTTESVQTPIATPTPKPTQTTQQPSQPQASCVIKGNISYNTGEKIHHVPGGDYYDQTVIDTSNGERWFCTEAEAVAAGWRKSKV